MNSTQKQALSKTIAVAHEEIAEFRVLSSSKSMLAWLVFTHTKFSNRPCAFKTRATLFLYPSNSTSDAKKNTSHSATNREIITVTDEESGHYYSCELRFDENAQRVNLKVIEKPKSDIIFISRRDLNGISKSMWKPMSNNFEFSGNPS